MINNALIFGAVLLLGVAAWAQRPSALRPAGPQVSVVQPAFQAAAYLFLLLPLLAWTRCLKGRPLHKDVDSTTSIKRVSTPAHPFFRARNRT